jgi:hypothetical protein
MPSASSPIKETLEGYLAGRVSPERVVIALAGAYYRDEGVGKRNGLGPLIEVIDRASPGVVELGSVDGGPGFDVRLAERPFPADHEPELRRAVEAYLVEKTGQPVGAHQGGAPHAAPRPHNPRLLARLLRAIRRLLTASA